MKFDASSILVIRMSGIGDVLWTTPLLRNLRRAYPAARIGYIVRTNSRMVLENNPDVDDIIEFDDQRLRKQAGFLRRLRRKGYELSIDLVCSPGTALMSWYSGAKVRIGFDFRYRQNLYNHRLSAHAANEGHEVEFHLFPLNYMEVPITDTNLVWVVSGNEREFAEHFLQDAGITPGEPLVGFIPTGGYPSKKWAPASYGAVGKELARMVGRILVFWGNEFEHAEAEHIAAIIGPRCIVVPPMTLRHAAAVIDRCSLIIGNDTGPLHVATALHPSVIALYGPTIVRSQRPWGKNVRVLRAPDVDSYCCHKTHCANPLCMINISPDMVLENAREVLAERARLPV